MESFMINIVALTPPEILIEMLQKKLSEFMLDTTNKKKAGEVGAMCMMLATKMYAILEDNGNPMETARKITEEIEKSKRWHELNPEKHQQ